jgi:DNA polymerase-3 subunit delta'
MSDIPAFLPWQGELAKRWLGERNRFAHAWLIHGLKGTGKRRFALAAAASLLCEAPKDGLACGACAACQWLASGNHPDLRLIRPDAVALEEGGAGQAADDGADASASASASKKAPSKDIRVDQLRTLNTWFNTATHRGGWRVAVVYPAESLNLVSANALLKVLEEPPEHTVFLLVADAPDRLLPTLVSRCRRLPLPVPEQGRCLEWLEAQGIKNAGSWLAAAGGAPVQAQQQAQLHAHPYPEWLTLVLDSMAVGKGADIGLVADQLEKQTAEIWIDALQRLFFDLLLARSGATVRYFPDLADKIRATASRADLTELAQMCQWLAEQRRVAAHPLNAKLFTHSTLQRAAMAGRPLY